MEEVTETHAARATKVMNSFILLIKVSLCRLSLSGYLAYVGRSSGGRGCDVCVCEGGGDLVSAEYTQAVVGAVRRNQKRDCLHVAAFGFIVSLHQICDHVVAAILLS